MTTLYRPVLIESAEQAEALPVGTVATHSSGAGMDHAHKVGPGDHLSREWMSLSADVTDAKMVGWTALVPLDVEVEHLRHTLTGRIKTLYITPWQPDVEPPAEDGDALADCTA